ncbi:helix-turn-helix transcriptional regulator [Lentzea sp. E54]|uniref:helix-turn-helix transcriptional regulator n=1 Tax=Lentzea xerophila TaxID=3435883 RepID=UPI003DA22140
MDPLSFAARLREWRDRLDPADAGFSRSPKRRAPGLRREELAQLAGLSVEYLLRLEQGRATNPSPQVVAALSRALQLKRAERDVFYESAGLLPPQDGLVETYVSRGVQRLATRLGDVPIGIFAADWSLLWWNDMWVALHGDPVALTVKERNLARALFGTGAARAYLRPMHSSAGQDSFEASIVADLKKAALRYPADLTLTALITELRETSPAFSRLWTTVDMAALTSDEKTIQHPDVGELILDCDVLTVPDSDLRMVTYTTATDSPDQAKLDLLRVAARQSTTRHLT